MKCAEVLPLVGQYFEGNLVSEVVDGDCLLVTPFLSADVAPVELWIHDEQDGIVVSDEGEAINQLFVSGVDVYSSKPLLAIARRIAKQMEVEFYDGAYYARATTSTLGEVVHKVAQASQAASYLVLKRTGRSPSRFDDVVEKLLIDNSITYVEKYSLRGKANTQTVPFFINSDKNVLLQPITAVTVESARTKAQKVAYKWLDLQQKFEDRYRYTVLLDDLTDQKATVWQDEEAFAPLVTYSTRVYQFATEMPALIQSLQHDE